MRRPAEQHEAAPPRVVAYCRFSTDQQNPRSVSDQLRLCQRFCERQGWPAIPPEAVFADEAQSGGGVQRTAYQRLLGLIATSNGKPPFDVVLIEDFSRLTRQMTEMSRLRDAAPIWGVKVIDISTNTDITDDAALYKGIGNEQFLKDLRRRIRRGLSGRFEDGFHPGGSAYGFRSVPVADPSGRRDRWGQPILRGHKLEVDPDQAAVIRRIYTEAAAGVSPRDIAHDLDRDGVPKPCCAYAMTKGADRDADPVESQHRQAHPPQRAVPRRVAVSTDALCRPPSRHGQEGHAARAARRGPGTGAAGATAG
jgi:site-specific DNA recombinase